MKPETLALRRVRRGARLLDIEYPLWRERINLETLDIGRMSECVLGQVYAHFSEGLDQLGLQEHQAVLNHGFDGDPSAGIAYDLLQYTWVQELLRA